MNLNTIHSRKLKLRVQKTIILICFKHLIILFLMYTCNSPRESKRERMWHVILLLWAFPNKAMYAHLQAESTDQCLLRNGMVLGPYKYPQGMRVGYGWWDRKQQKDYFLDLSGLVWIAENRKPNYIQQLIHHRKYSHPEVCNQSSTCKQFNSVRYVLAVHT